MNNQLKKVIEQIESNYNCPEWMKNIFPEMPRLTFYINKAKKTIVCKRAAGETAKVKLYDGDQWNEYTGMLAAYIKLHKKAGLSLNDISKAKVVYQGEEEPTCCFEVVECAKTADNEGFILLTAKGEGISFLDCGDGKTFVSKDVIFMHEFNKNTEKKNANFYKGSDMQKAVNKWFDENAPQDVKDQYEPDLLTMTEIFGEVQEDGEPKFWPNEPYKRLPLFRDWRNRIKGLKDSTYPSVWATKSPRVGNDSVICFICDDGSAGGRNAVHNIIGVTLCLRKKPEGAKTKNAKTLPEDKGIEIQNAPEQTPIAERSGKIPDTLKDPRWLAFWLDQNNVSIHDAAQLCGVSFSTIQRASQGFFVRPKSFKKIVDGLGLSNVEAADFKRSLVKHQRWVY